MKKFIVLTIVIGLFISSCGDGEPKYDTSTEYTIKNISTQKVKLIVEDDYFNNEYKDTIYLLLPNTEIQHLNEHMTPIDGPFGPGADTVIVVFNDIKQIIYFRDDGKPKSLFNIKSFEGSYTKYGLYKYRYYITEEDYSNATTME